MRVLRENEGTEFLGLMPEHVPEIEGLSLFRASPGHLGLRAEGIAGAVPLTNGETLQIVPKNGVNLYRMLLRSWGLDASIKQWFDDAVALGASAEQTPLALFAPVLLEQLDRVRSKSLAFRARRTKVTTSFLRGRVDYGQTLVRLATGTAQPVCSEVSRRSFDLAEHRVFAAAAQRVVAATGQRKSTTSWWVRRFPASGERLVNDIATVRRTLAAGAYRGSRGYYRQPVTLALLVLGNHGVELSEEQPVESLAFVVQTATVFEEYLRTVLAQHLQPEGLDVRKSFAPARHLYEEAGFKLEPDICVYRGSELQLVADAKYKSRPDISDHYQMHAYLRASEQKRGVLLFATAGNHESRTVQRSNEGLEVEELGLPLGDLARTEMLLRDLVP